MRFYKNSYDRAIVDYAEMTKEAVLAYKAADTPEKLKVVVARYPAHIIPREEEQKS